MNRRAVRLLAVLVAAATALMVYMVFLRGWGRGTEAPAAGSGAARTATVPTPAPAPASAPAEAPRGRAPAWTLDADREGPLRLEGQVIGPDGTPVGRAIVTLAAIPPRTLTAEDDGTFAFDKLVGRTYQVSARKDLLLGTVRYKLTLTSDPAVVRLAEGAAVAVTVTDDKAAPIAGATVKATGDAELTVTTDAAGTARLAPVTPGWIAVEASAPGYAPASLFTTIGSAGATGTLTIALARGYPVAGKVIDEAGAAIARASVRIAPGLWSFGMDLGEAITTDDAGRFTLAALPAGSHVLTATDGHHAPARSAPITVADRAVSGITITMKAGARIAGRVIDADKRPVAFATVRVAGKGADAWQTTARQASTDKDGAFELDGLARTTLQARAESDTAASKVAVLELADKAELTGVELVLDVTGQIAGTVVDDKGAPVAEVTVNAFPDLFGGNRGDGLALAGMSSASTDGAGGFVIRGLPDGAYKLWAARSSSSDQEWGQQGTAATTGDTGVKIVLAAPGELKGTIKLDGDTAPPAIASVQIGSKPPTPAQGGVFVARDLTPGTYDVAFRGPQFAETIKRGIVIKPGATTDMGTVTVVRGRRLAGKIVDNTGAAVAGAKIRVGTMLFTSEGNEAQMEEFESQGGIRVAVSDQDGRFTIVGVPRQETTAMAAHPERGRSLGTSVPAGTDDVGPVTLTLRGYGSVTGKVTLKGKPLGNATVGWSSKGGGASAAFGQTADDGTFTFARVPEGTTVIQAMQTGMMTMKTTAVTVEVTAGRPSTATIEVPVGQNKLTITIKPVAGAQVDAAQVFLFNGTVAYLDGKQLTDAMFGGGAQGMKFWLGKALPMPEFDELVPGTYSACSIPITGSMSDATLMQRIQENIPTLKVYCKQVTVKPAPLAQELTQELPSMDPLPAPTE